MQGIDSCVRKQSINISLLLVVRLVDISKLSMQFFKFSSIMNNKSRDPFRNIMTVRFSLGDYTYIYLTTSTSGSIHRLHILLKLTYQCFQNSSPRNLEYWKGRVNTIWQSNALVNIVKWLSLYSLPLFTQPHLNHKAGMRVQGWTK